MRVHSETIPFTTEPSFLATKIKKRKPTPPAGLSEHAMRALKLVYGGAQHLDRGDRQKAESTWREAAEVDPQCVPAWTMLTDLLALTDRTADALFCLDRLISASPKTAANLYTLADKCCFLKQYEQARGFLAEALRLNPSVATQVQCRLVLAQIAFIQEDWAESIAEANRALELDPRNIDGLSIRQRSYFCTSYSPEDVADCRTILNIQPNADRHSRLLFKLNYLPETTPESLYEESRAWNESYAAPLASEIVPHINIPDPDRPLRIGYVSPDFRNHAIMRLLPGVFENHDKQQFEIFAYSVDTKQDMVTDYVRSVVPHFTELPLDKYAIASRVREDKIDILVDLAGHSMQVDGYLAFALKPAPVQATWMGVLATTGLTTMDYFIGDMVLPAPGTEHLFSEKVYRLPRNHSCYRPIGDPGIAPSPYFQNGYLTFGSFNDLRKITREAVQLWSIILHMHPGSKLLMKYINLQMEIVQRRFLNWFHEDGISPDRIEFQGQSKPIEYLATLNKVDIALDPFPYTGGTTTLDTLWMGVPIVSLSGRLTVATCGASLMAEVGFPVASSKEQYIALASQLAQSIPAHPELRQKMRDTMLKSRLMDGPDLTRHLEAAYREMWRGWCATQPPFKH